MNECRLYNLLEGEDLELGTSCTCSPEERGLIDLAMGTVEGFYNDSKSNHRLLELCFSKDSLFKQSKRDNRRTRHFNIKNRTQREVFLKTLKDLHDASDTHTAIQSCLDAFDGKGKMTRENAIQKMKEIEKCSSEYPQVANLVAAPPVSLFHYHHSDMLSNASKCQEKSPIRQIVNHEKIIKQHSQVKKSSRHGALDKIVVQQPIETT